MSKRKKLRFADAVIILCLTICVIITGVTLWEYHRLGEPLPAEVLKPLLRIWGGELLIIALRQVLGTDIVDKAKTKEDISDDLY